MKRGNTKAKICYYLKRTARRIKANPSAAYFHKCPCSSFSISYGLNRFQPSYNEKRYRLTQKSREGHGLSNLQRYAFVLLDCHVETALFSKFISLNKLIIFLILETNDWKEKI